jgi:N-acetyl-gamma-glutamyl-phosphate reductase
VSDVRLRAAVLGAAGLVGGELLRLLALHPEVGEILPVSKSHAGRAVSAAHRPFLHLPPLTFVDLPAGEAARRVDVVFCAMPHGDSQKVMAELLDAAPRCIIDLGADFRIRDAASFAAHYGAHARPDLLDRFVYGLPEVYGQQIRGARCIANPGCFATAAQLLVLPLAAAKLLPATCAAFAVTGSSGAGAAPKPTTHHPFRAENLFAYKPLAHQHEAEIEQTLSEVAGAPRHLRLLSHSGPFVRGIHATAYFKDDAFAGLDLPQLYRDFYAGKPFVAVLDRPPEVAEVAGANYVHVHAAQQGDEVELLLVLDNLVKGAAGQAIQNMNLALGLPETVGLEFPGAFPC